MASELLEEFIKVESRKINNDKMPHMPTLGSAFEEITKQGIDKVFVIPKFLDLRVVSGFISVNGKLLPQQIDCMLVHGSGERYGLTEQYIYEIDKVLCIFEVKKTLRKVDYTDAFFHLGGIRKGFAQNFERKLIDEGYEPDISTARKHFSQITGKIAPEQYPHIHDLNKSDAILFYTLVQETLAPISIIHGYEGYKTENGLRSAFTKILEEKKRGVGLGVPSIPNLVTSNQFCLVKGSGTPFLTMKDKNEWVAIASTRYNPARMILEVIWSKISLYFGIEMPWDDGLYMEKLQPLLVAQPVENNNKSGWIYKVIELKEKSLERDNDGTWRPMQITEAEVSAINIMAFSGGYLELNKDLESYFNTDYKKELCDVVTNLLYTRMFMQVGEYLRPIATYTYLLTSEDGAGFVAIEKERFDLWCAKHDIEPSYLILSFFE